MGKSILVVTHERSGTHMLINIINNKNNGDYSAIGRLPENKKHDIDTYKEYVYKYILMNANSNKDLVSKSHHQVEFFDNFLDYLYDNYHVIYLKRDIKDVLLSYYKFLNSDDNHKQIVDFPIFKDWIFMNPSKIGYKYFANYPDPHVINEPIDYIDRILIHQKGWEKQKDNILTLNYEDILTDFPNQKIKIEDYIGQKVSNDIPNINDKKLPNFYPNKGIIGGYLEYMDVELINKIDNYK
jgi:hypothetical protein